MLFQSQLISLVFCLFKIINSIINQMLTKSESHFSEQIDDTLNFEFVLVIA